jgi:flagellar biosynthesis chaperone FliJ
MNATEVIRQVQENASEWLEMSQNPDELIKGILANKIVKLQDHIEYLEKRLENVSSVRTPF